MDNRLLKKIIEAALLASTQPLSLPQLQALFPETDDPVGHEQLAAALDELRADCGERGIELVEVASGFRFQVRQDIHPWIARMWTERPSRYSRALLETLALIAYRQPITRGEIEQVRGVAVSSHIIKTLEEREWIRAVGHRDTPGRPALFGTTRTFLDYFNLKSLDELPPLADILNLEDPDPQLVFESGLGEVPAHVEPANDAAAPQAEEAGDQAGDEVEDEAETGAPEASTDASPAADATGAGTTTPDDPDTAEEADAATDPEQASASQHPKEHRA